MFVASIRDHAIMQDNQEMQIYDAGMQRASSIYAEQASLSFRERFVQQASSCRFVELRPPAYRR